MGFVDVLESALLKALGEAVVFVTGDVVVRFVEQFEGVAKTASPLQVGVDRRMFVNVLAILDGSLLDLCDGVFDFVDGFLFLLT